MAAWLGGQQIMSRTQITSFFWQYIKSQNLIVSVFGRLLVQLAHVPFAEHKMQHSPALRLFWDCALSAPGHGMAASTNSQHLN